jgi:hypothetical protein
MSRRYLPAAAALVATLAVSAPAVAGPPPGACPHGCPAYAATQAFKAYVYKHTVPQGDSFATFEFAGFGCSGIAHRRSECEVTSATCRVSGVVVVVEGKPRWTYRFRRPSIVGDCPKWRKGLAGSELARQKLAAPSPPTSSGISAGSSVGLATDVWFENSTGEWVVDLGPEATPSPTLAAGIVTEMVAMSDQGSIRSYRVNHVAYTRAELDEANEAVQTKLLPLVQADRAQAGIAEGAVQLHVASGLDAAETSIVEEAVGAASRVAGSPPVIVTATDQPSFHAETV